MFMDDLKETLNDEFNVSMTENGALGYRTSGKELLDMNFAVTSMRSMSEEDIIKKFIKVFYEDKMLAVKWLFFARDCREGLGERRLFRICIKYLAETHLDIVKAVIPIVAEYGRWDDLLCLLDTSLDNDVIDIFHEQLISDLKNMECGSGISLLSKWLPSTNTSSKETRRLARIIASKFDMTEKQYRKTLSKLRSYLKIVEVSMSKNEWSSIDYSSVPSRANLIYSNAFLRNDEERRREYLSSLEKGETKINAGVLFPHDIVHKYCNDGGYDVAKQKDTTLEELWEALPDYVQDAGNTICVADGSYSMTVRVGNTNVTALEVANALAIYFSERSSGQFKDKYITFSSKPQFVDFSNANSLREKLEIALEHNECSNTNIEAVFDLILTTAVKKHMNQADLPQNILILSDMEYDRSARDNSGIFATPKKRLFDEIADRYSEYGYKIPRLVFWNINSRTGTIPVKENECGVALVSGFSPVITKMVLSNKTDPYECLLEQLNAERYDAVESVIKDLV